MTSPNSIPPLHGLVLAGGRSRRMGRDKAALAYHDGVPHVRRTADLLAAVCERVFVSVRADQVDGDDAALASLPPSVGRIPDALDVGGPINGILSALQSHPGAAFLVVACDLPFLSAGALATLVAGRDPAKVMTCFGNPARENLPEPLCAIYEPAYAGQARAVMDLGLTCPTKIADALDGRRLELADAAAARFLDNANTPEDYERAVRVEESLYVGSRESGVGREVDGGFVCRFDEDGGRYFIGKETRQTAGFTSAPDSRLPTSGTVTIEYFAVFRAQAKRASEEIPFESSSLADLYESLRARHGFALSRDAVHVAVNDAYASWDAVLQPGDRVVFIPPVSGG